MAIKTTTNPEEAYPKPARLKRKNEIFAEVISRVFGGPSAMQLAGLLDLATDDKVGATIRNACGDLTSVWREPGRA